VKYWSRRILCVFLSVRSLSPQIHTGFYWLRETTRDPNKGTFAPRGWHNPSRSGNFPRQYFRRRIISARIKSRVASTSATTSQGQNNSLLTVLVVVTPDFHKLICRKFLEFAGMGVAILPHEVCCFFQVEPFAVNLIRLGRHLCDNSEKRKQD
jgi:hypothetical protein